MNNFEDMLQEINSNNLLVKLDNLEEKIRISDEIQKEYNDIKKQIKEAMLKIGKENNLEQIKWTTPNGIKITLSIGRTEELEKQRIKVFKEEILKEKYPKIYEECQIEEEQMITITSGSNDRLVITLPKEKK